MKGLHISQKGESQSNLKFEHNVITHWSNGCTFFHGFICFICYKHTIKYQQNFSIKLVAVTECYGNQLVGNINVPKFQIIPQTYTF